MSSNPIESQFSEAFTLARLNHGLLNREIAKAVPNLDSLFEYTDKLRDAVAVMRILDDILKRQATAYALAVPTERA